MEQVEIPITSLNAKVQYRLSSTLRVTVYLDGSSILQRQEFQDDFHFGLMEHWREFQMEHEELQKLVSLVSSMPASVDAKHWWQFWKR